MSTFEETTFIWEKPEPLRKYYGGVVLGSAHLAACVSFMFNSNFYLGGVFWAGMTVYILNTLRWRCLLLSSKKEYNQAKADLADTLRWAYRVVESRENDH